MMAHKKNCWFQLLITIVGMCVFGFHGLYLNSIKRGATTIQECKVRKISYFIFQTLLGTHHKPWYKFIRHRSENNINFTEHLVRITDRNGKTNRYPTDKQKITAKHAVIPSQITVLYAESICKEIE